MKLELFETNDHHTICPFKAKPTTGPTASDPAAQTLVDISHPFPEVAGLAGSGVYHEKEGLRVEIQTPSPDGAGRPPFLPDSSVRPVTKGNREPPSLPAYPPR